MITLFQDHIFLGSYCSRIMCSRIKLFQDHIVLGSCVLGSNCSRILLFSGQIVLGSICTRSNLFQDLVFQDQTVIRAYCTMFSSSLSPCRGFSLVWEPTPPLTRISLAMWYFNTLASSLGLPRQQADIRTPTGPCCISMVQTFTNRRIRKTKTQKN